MHFAKERDVFLAGITLIQVKGLQDITVCKYMMV
jgi:hypothetical protein